MKRHLLFYALFLVSILSHAQFQEASFMINGYTLPYQVLFPKNYNESQRYPLVVFLHGAGERGNDNQKQLTHGKDFFINNFETENPAIVIAPQCPENTYWGNVQSHTVAGHREFKFGISNKPTPAMETLIYLIEDWLVSGRVDTKQVYVGGLSMGGMGTFELLWRMPNTFAAAFPICGGGEIEKVQNYTHNNTALWIFHGADDSVVPADFSRKMYQTLLSAGNEVKYTEYPNVNHNSWDNAFQEKELASWLFKHKK
jgi:predicted peptidase